VLPRDRMEIEIDMGIHPLPVPVLMRAAAKIVRILLQIRNTCDG
jgi:hypothetical protein